MDRRCSHVDCAQPSAVTLGDNEYCVVHFILTCYQLLEKSPPDRSLPEIIDRAAAIGLTVANLTNQEKGQLLDIILWAGDSLRHPAKGASNPLVKG
jgi:hypothetical protein